MTEETIPADTIPADAGTSADTLTAPAVVTIPGTAATPPVTISAAEHQLLADLKASGHDFVELFNAAVVAGEKAI